MVYLYPNKIDIKVGTYVISYNKSLSIFVSIVNNVKATNFKGKLMTLMLQIMSVHYL